MDTETQTPGIISKCHSRLHSTTTHTWILFVIRKIFLSSPLDPHSVYCLGFPSGNKCPMPTIPEKVPKPSSGCQKSQNVTTGSSPYHQAQVYDILPPTTAVVHYAIGLEKLSANEQFSMVLKRQQICNKTTQIISDVSFITDHVANASTNNTLSLIHISEPTRPP